MAAALAPSSVHATQRTTEIISALSNLIRSARALARQHHQQRGASGTPVTVLKALAHHPEQDRPGDLAVVAGVAPSVMSRVIARLEEDGLVSRHKDELDARACHMALTDAGRAQLAAIEQQYTELLGAALGELPDDELDRLPATLHALEQALNSALGRPVPPHSTPLAPSLAGELPAVTRPAPIHESR
jgi:DNA-binding MarR family transcriptional regulator